MLIGKIRCEVSRLNCIIYRRFSMTVLFGVVLYLVDV